MQFESYIYSLPNPERLAIMNFLTSYGDPNTVLNHLFSIPVCYVGKDIEARVDHKYLLVYRPKHWWTKTRVYIYETDKLQSVYFSEGTNMASEIGLVNPEGRYVEIQVPGKNAIYLFNRINAYLKSVQDIPPCSPAEKNQVFRIKCPFYVNAEYILQNGTIRLTHKGWRGSLKEELLVLNINDLVWCKQECIGDSEGSDSYEIKLHFADGHIRTISGETSYDTYRWAVELKKRVPHMLYGNHAEYERIYKRNPAELMAFAKSQRRW